MMQIAPLTKMIMNLCKQDRLDAWATFGLPLHIEVVFQKLICRTESVLHSSHALRCVAAIITIEFFYFGHYNQRYY